MSEIRSNRAPVPVGAYPHARKVGNLLFLSGVGPRSAPSKGGSSKEIPGVRLNEKGEILEYDIETQCRAVFENVKVILEDAGSSWANIVDITVFLTSMKRDFAIFNKVYAEHFPANPDSPPRPCRTTVEVGALPTPIAVELKVIATI